MQHFGELCNSPHTRTQHTERVNRRVAAQIHSASTNIFRGVMCRFIFRANHMILS